MKITSRIGAAWRALTGQRDNYAATYGGGGSHGFAGGAINRLTASLASYSGSVNADLDGALPVLRARARHLAANNEHGKRFLSLVATNVVGRQNPRLQVRAMKDQRNPNAPAQLDKAANDTIEIHWERWGRTCDVANRHKTLYSLLRTTVKGVARDGEALIRVIRNKKLPYGMALQLLEADRLTPASMPPAATSSTAPCAPSPTTSRPPTPAKAMPCSAPAPSACRPAIFTTCSRRNAPNRCAASPGSTPSSCAAR